MSNNIVVGNNTVVGVSQIDIQGLWGSLAVQFAPNNPNNEVMIQGPVFATLSAMETTFILQAYAFHTGQLGMFVRDAAINRVFLGPAYHYQNEPLVQVAGQIPILMSTIITLPGGLQSASPSSSIDSTPVATPQSSAGDVLASSSALLKIRRPPNAFIIYRKAHHANILAQNPGLHNNQISVIIGTMWNNESAQVRANFKAQADVLKQEHLRLHPDYQYKPRKPSERKKRMSKKKAAAQADKVAKTRAKSIQNVSQYRQMSAGNGQFIGMPDEIRSITLPLSTASAGALHLQGMATNPGGQNDFEKLGADFGPTAVYNDVQAADNAFFPELDFNDPQLQSLLDEVGEAYEAGFYDDLSDSCHAYDGPVDADFNYELTPSYTSSAWA